MVSVGSRITWQPMAHTNNKFPAAMAAGVPCEMKSTVLRVHLFCLIGKCPPTHPILIIICPYFTGSLATNYSAKPPNQTSCVHALFHSLFWQEGGRVKGSI